MSIEEATTQMGVATAAMNTLTDAVNVKKATLDASVADAEEARDTTQGYRDTTEGHKNEAAGSAATSKVWADSALAVSGNAAAAYVASLPYGTDPVDVFVAPCGVPEWLRLGMGMEWANEEVHTGPQIGMFASEAQARAYCQAQDPAITEEGVIFESAGGAFFKLAAVSGFTQITRADQPEMPRTFIGVLLGHRLILRNGDKPNAPMWCDLDMGTGNMNAAKFINGRAYVSVSTAGLLCWDFTQSRLFRWVVFGLQEQPWTRDGAGAGFTTIDASKSTPSSAVAHFDTHVLTDAPIENGVQVPTVAVAHDPDGAGYLSIIKDTGEVVSYAASTSSEGYEFYHVNFDDVGNLYAVHSFVPNGQFSTINFFASETLRDLEGNASPSQGHGQIDWGFGNKDTSLSFTDEGRNVSWRVTDICAGPERQFVIGNARGAFLMFPEGDDETGGMTRHIANTHDTGMMLNGTVFAGLCEDDDTDLVGNAYVEEDFADDVDAFEGVLSGTIEHEASDGGSAVLTGDGVSGNVRDGISISLAAGQTVYLETEFEQDSVNPGNLAGLRVGNGTPSFVSLKQETTTDDSGILRLWYTSPTSQTVQAVILGSSVSGQITRFKYLNVKLADPDRSDKGKGIVPNGTVTRTRENGVVWYSGFSGDDYLEQPYNPDLPTGLDELSIAGWLKMTSVADYILHRVEQGQNTSDEHMLVFVQADGFLQFSTRSGGTTSNALGTKVVNTGKPVFFCITLEDAGETVKFYVDGDLDASETIVARNMAFSNEVLRIGTRGDGQFEFLGSLARLRIANRTATAEQITRMNAVERTLFYPDAQATLLDKVVRKVSWDPIRRIYLVLTDGGLVEMTEWGQILRTDATVDSNAVAQRGGLKVVA
ncbi:LamG domain-containing protein [Marivita sp.]|uniref:LamG domain-containing protein n=1 Tax=Marivita sp. TaxID=2003365 RepID=UPI003F6FE0E3